MASFPETSDSYPIAVTSYDTALCVLPPIEQCEHIDSLRELYDMAYGRWPAHINLVYPFVSPEHLSQARQQIQAQLQRNVDSSRTRRIKLDSAGLIKQRHNSTAIVQEPQGSSDGPLKKLRSLALQALGHRPKPHNFHLTIGQTEDNSVSSLEFLLSKVRLLPTLEFEIGYLAILVRERMSGEHSVNRMRLWDLVNVIPRGTAKMTAIPDYWLKYPLASSADMYQDADRDDMSDSTTAFSRAIQPGRTFFFDKTLTPLTVSSYNVLVDSEYPPAQDRDHLLLSTLQSDSAKADVLILQEVSDCFLSSLLNNAKIQNQYPFTSHGPPSQSDIGPLPSLRNVIVISKWPFRWELVPFQRKHKGAIVAVFDTVVPGGSLIVAGVHLTCGLTDGSVAAKKVQAQSLIRHLTHHYLNSPWVIAGDFNIATSTHTIHQALQNKLISSQTNNTLAAIESLLSEDGLVDAWLVARDEQCSEADGDDADRLFDGEQGATFDPRNNMLAAATSVTSHNRPQRYDRILVRPQRALRITGFNMFGLPAELNGASVVPSDHYGVRASLQLLKPTEQLSPDHCETLNSLRVELRRVPHLATRELVSVLSRHCMFLTEEENTRRRLAFVLLEEVVLEKSQKGYPNTADIPLVMVAVGSHAMNVDTAGSDIDCLCIGTISSKTFFKLVRQRLHKAESQGIRILRKVEASTGTMLELSVNGVPMDLQYCPAARVVERWFEFDNLPASDPIFNLSILSLRKLKPYRDLLYIKRTIPDHATFSLAYRCIKLWATQRGIYSSKFGFLGGVHITLMLSWVYKRIAHDIDTQNSSPIRTDDLVTSFFHYYANFNWVDDIVFDAFFHKQKPRYHRTAREPMVVLGFHAPNSNVAHTSTVSGLSLLVQEFKSASLRLSEPGMTWQDFFEPPGMHSFTGMDLGETQFLQLYRSYVSIDIQFWGRTLTKGKSLVGWVESRCLSLVVDINKFFSNTEVRLWPARFTKSGSTATSDNNDYHGCYLIGLQKATTVPLGMSSSDERRAAKQSLEKVIDRFLTQLRMDEKNYDTSTSWIDASLTTQHDIQTRELRLDDREWGDYAMEIEPDSDDEEGLDELDDEDADLPKLPVRSKPSSTSTPVSTTKLRPASDVLNRLRWDPKLDPADYIIGYEDRFLGTRETSLEKWKTEQTDEEFIPQHRILYFRRKFNNEGDGRGELIWERATRIDKIFGSGAGFGS
ncbi:polynucleotide adenylyltransferase [Ascochyta rabiei]|uniref:polynucleotide adenylyltransferase n=1 Tax=Didymella rabiei TaxID=5454 RepID=A0A163GR90_DIDRA|nr:polynucleotide adenylyltransferase [Ascochyta rabiei]